MEAEELLRLAAKSRGYCEGYDDAIRDVLKALDDEPDATGNACAMDIRNVMKDRHGWKDYK